MVKTGTTVDVNKVPEFLAGIKFLAENRVLVGIPSSKNEREDEEGNPSPIGNAAIGFIQEKGDPAMNLPARPWLKPGVASDQPGTNDLFKKAGKAALEGNSKKAQDIYTAIGLRNQRAVQRYIKNSGNFAPLSDRTLWARKNRKIAPRTGEKPLIDSAQLLQHVSFVIAKIKSWYFNA